MPEDDPTTPVPPRPRRHWWLLALPFVWCIGAIPVVNRDVHVFGSVPLLLVWMVAGVVVGSAAIGIVFAVDSRNGDIERT